MNDLPSKLSTRAAAALSPAFVLLSLTGQLADGDTLTIGSVTYEADDDATITAGNVAVDITSNASAADDIDDLVTAIKANQGGDYQVSDLGDELLVVGTLARPIVASEVIGNGVLVNDGTDYLAPVEDVNFPAIQTRVPTAAEVTLGKMVFTFGSAPTAAIIQARVTATGIDKVWNGGYSIEGRSLILDNTGATDWAATDTVTVAATF